MRGREDGVNGFVFDGCKSGRFLRLRREIGFVCEFFAEPSAVRGPMESLALARMAMTLAIEIRCLARGIDSRFHGYQKGIGESEIGAGKWLRRGDIFWGC